MRKVLVKTLALAACLLCSLSAVAAEAYACFTSSDSTLTFYYDNDRSSHSTTYDVPASGTPGWRSISSQVKKVLFDASFEGARPTSTSYWFYSMGNLENITNLYLLNTSQVTNMSYMFSYCKKLKRIDLTHFNTSQVTNMGMMFYQCYGLTSLNLCKFNTSKVTNMSSMFFDCENLTTIYSGSGWSTSAVTSSTNMFAYCTSLVGEMGTAYNASHLDKSYAHADGGTSNPGYFTETQQYAVYTPSNTTLTFYYDKNRSSYTSNDYDMESELDGYPGWYTRRSTVTRVVFNQSFANARPTTTKKWFYEMTNLTSISNLNWLNTSEVTDMDYMFYGCSSLANLNVSSFNTANVESMAGMFAYCSGLSSLNLTNFNTSKVTDMFFMFYGCSNLVNLNQNFNTSQVTIMQDMFANCTSLTSLDLSSFNTAHVTSTIEMFLDCNNLVKIYVSGNWNMSNIRIDSNMFKGCNSIVGEKGTTYDDNHRDSEYAHIDGGPSNPGYLRDYYETYAVYTPSNSTLTFRYDRWKATAEGTVYDLNTGSDYPEWYSDGITSSITRVVFESSFANARPISTAHWFESMYNLASISGLNYLNTSQVTNMQGMFAYCSPLTSLDVSNFNTENVTDMSALFKNCDRLETLDLSGFNTAQVTNMKEMFMMCPGLKSLDVSGFNTAKVTNMESMFAHCTDLTSLDLSSFNTSKVTNMTRMFYNCSSMVTIFAGNDWSTSAVTSSNYMFSYCTEIRGEKGTTYDANHTNKLYARIDGGTSSPGYLSRPIKAYAVYTPSNTTLTFYYDSESGSRTGTVYDLNTGNNYPGWNTSGTNASVTRVVFDSSFASTRPTSTLFWFEGMSNLQSITGMKNYLNTSQVTNMAYMFWGCSNLTSLDVSGFNTAQVTNMAGLFQHCEKLTSLDVSNFNTANVTDMAGMFGYCKCLTSIDVSNFNTAQVTNMIGMFEYCNALSYLGLSNFNTAKVRRMDRMFEYCNKLTSLNLSSFNTAKVTNMNDMFECCNKLTSLNLSSFNTAKVTNMTDMFYNCDQLVTVYAGSDWNTTAVTASNDMFYNCTSIKGSKGTTFDSNNTDKLYARIDGGSSRPGYLSEVTDETDEAYAVYTSDNTTLTFFYDDLSYNRPGTIYTMNSGAENPGWVNDLNCQYVTSVVFDSSFGNYRPTTTYKWFYYMPRLTDITGMDYLKTNNVTNMAYMFYYCPNLTSIDLTNFATWSVTDMSFMFFYCSGLESLDVSNFNTEDVTDMSYMFEYCSALENLDVSSFRTENVTNMRAMFLACMKLKDLNLSRFNTANVTDMAGMFGNCYALTSLDLSSFNTSKVTNMNSMFAYSEALTTIYASNYWSTAAVTTSDQMFRNCTSLVGSMGTAYDPNHIDATYARIDGGPSNPGYLSQTMTRYYGVYTPENTTLTLYYDNQWDSRPGQVYVSTDPDDIYPAWNWGDFYQEVTRVVIDPSFADYRPTSTYAWFAEMWHLESITGLEYLNTSEVTDMSYMFSYCMALSSVDLSHFVTSKVTDMSYMFECCYAFTDLDLSHFNTSNVTTMQCMFSECENVSNLNVRSFNTANVTDFLGMFSNCRNVRHLDISSFNTANGENMRSMFWDCRNMTTICAGNGWSTASVTDSENMFYNCTKIVGGKGTTFDANHTDKAYARIDGGPSSPGYFSELLLGDVNGDGKVNIGDVTDIIDYLLTGNTDGINIGVADVNFDGVVSIADVTDVIDYLLKGTW